MQLLPIISAVYLEKFTYEVQNLLKYGHMIREMLYLHGDMPFGSMTSNLES